MVCGFFQGMSNELYHSSNGISKSGLDAIYQSPADYKFGVRKPSDAYRIGTATHTLILEPHLFESTVLKGLDKERRSKADKLSWANYFDDHGAKGQEIVSLKAMDWFHTFESQTGKQIVTPSESEDLKRIVDSVNNNQEAIGFLTGGEAETSGYWNDPETGVLCRFRPDSMKRHEHIITDLKTTADASLRGFEKSVRNFRYFAQDSWYSEGYRNIMGVQPRFVLIYIMKTPPYHCVVYELDEQTKEMGYWANRRDLNLYAECLKNDHWPQHKNRSSVNVKIFEDIEEDL